MSQLTLLTLTLIACIIVTSGCAFKLWKPAAEFLVATGLDLPHILTLFLFALIAGVIAASGCIFQILTTMALVAVALAQCCLHHTDVLAESKLDTEILTTMALTTVTITQWRPQDTDVVAETKADAEALSLKEELRSHAAQIASLQSDKAIHLKLFKSLMADKNKIRRTMTRHYIEFTLKLGEVDDELTALNGVLTGKGNAAEGRGAANDGQDLISWTPSTAVPPTSAAMAVAVAADAIPGLINWVSLAATASPSATTPPSKEQTKPRSRIPIPDPSLQSNLAGPCSAKARQRSENSNLRTSPCSSKSNAIHRATAAFTFKSKLPVLDRAQAVKTTAAPATPVTMTQAAEAMDLISPASAANVASLAALPLPRLSSKPTTVTCSVDVNQAVEGLISHNSAAHIPSPVTQLPASVPNMSPTITRRWCGVIANTVALPRPDKDEEDFFASRQGSPLKRSAPEHASLESKGPKLKQQQAKMAENAKDRKHLLKYMSFMRSKLNGADDPAKAARSFQRVLSTKGLSIESLEADYEALLLAGYEHNFKIPELFPHVKEALKDDHFLER
ncbi:hypothetical protein HDU77_004342 [Chytriomyces hyalinus]|nr:hypothetical protein HDU77_004342 [Chytriomyces hyalinus]